MRNLNKELEDQENAERLTPAAELNAELIAVLQRIAPFYRNTMWSKADEANRRWIDEASHGMLAIVKDAGQPNRSNFLERQPHGSSRRNHHYQRSATALLRSGA